MTGIPVQSEGPSAASSAIADATVNSAVAAAISVATAAGLRTVDAWAFTVIHGPIENDHDAASVRLLTDVARSTGHLLTTYGANDTVVHVFAPSGGRLACLAMQAQALTSGRLWWRTFTRFGGDR